MALDVDIVVVDQGSDGMLVEPSEFDRGWSGISSSTSNTASTITGLQSVSSTISAGLACSVGNRQHLGNDEESQVTSLEGSVDDGSSGMVLKVPGSLVSSQVASMEGRQTVPSSLCSPFEAASRLFALYGNAVSGLVDWLELTLSGRVEDFLLNWTSTICGVSNVCSLWDCVAYSETVLGDNTLGGSGLQHGRMLRVESSQAKGDASVPFALFAARSTFGAVGLCFITFVMLALGRPGLDVRFRTFFPSTPTI